MSEEAQQWEFGWYFHSFGDIHLLLYTFMHQRNTE
jgi:hypothetical protein